MDTDSAYKLIEQAVRSGRMANGYLVTCDVRGDGMTFAERVLSLLFDHHVEDHSHPDIHWLYPEKKSRIISVEAIRTKLVDPLSKTSFAGGWKAAVIVGADRLNPESANAFLKTLEEPPPRTFFLLLTDRPDALLPTIVSRCQRIDLALSQTGGLDGETRNEILDILATSNLSGRAECAAIASRLAKVLEGFEETAAKQVDEELDDNQGEAVLEEDVIKGLISSRYREMRAGFIMVLLSWFRDLMALVAAGDAAPIINADRFDALRLRAENLDRTKAFQNITAVEELARAFDRSLPELPALAFWADRTVFGTGGGNT